MNKTITELLDENIPHDGDRHDVVLKGVRREGFGFIIGKAFFDGIEVELR